MAVALMCVYNRHAHPPHSPSSLSLSLSLSAAGLGLYSPVRNFIVGKDVPPEKASTW